MENLNQNKYTKIHRALHWAMALAMIVLLCTGFLRLEWMSKQSVIEAIQGRGIEMSKDDMVGIYKSLRTPMWKWHIYASYVMISTLILRIIYMIAKGIRFPNPFSAKNSFKDRFQGAIYILFYLFILEATITGSYIRWIDGSLKDQMEEIHKLGIYIFPSLILIHWVGIFIAEVVYKKGVVSKMIGGK